MNKTTPTRANVVVLKQMLNLIPLGMINRHARETEGLTPIRDKRGEWDRQAVWDAYNARGGDETHDGDADEKPLE